MATLIQTLQHALASRKPALSFETKRIVLKEVLQAYVLDFLYNHPLYRNLNFYGGTCLHVVYGLNRLSEDLDFDNGAGLDLSPLANALIAYFQATVGYERASAKLKQSERGGILRITLKFPVLNALGLAPLPDEALHLKLEVSPHEQVAVIKHTPTLFHGRSFVPSHFSLETMMAGKMLACLEREFRVGKSATIIKGRDYYDLLWFMQKQVRPLEEKLARDGEKPYTIQTAMRALQEKIASIKPSDLARDLSPLFESATYVDAWIQAFHDNFREYAQFYMG